MIAMMVSIVNSQRDALLSQSGMNVWSGQVIQALNSDAVVSSLAKELYGPGGPWKEASIYDYSLVDWKGTYFLF